MTLYKVPDTLYSMSLKNTNKRRIVNKANSSQIKDLTASRRPIWAPRDLCRKVQVHAKLYGYDTAAQVVAAGLALLEAKAKKGVPA